MFKLIKKILLLILIFVMMINNININIIKAEDEEEINISLEEEIIEEYDEEIILEKYDTLEYYENINEEELEGVHNESLYLSNTQIEKILSGELQLTYGLFGAKGDGKTNDYNAINDAHNEANNIFETYNQMITVYGESDKTYYIGYTSAPIKVITNVDWQGCHFIIDDYVDKDNNNENDVKVKEHIFDIQSPAGIGRIVLYDFDVSSIDGGKLNNNNILRILNIAKDRVNGLYYETQRREFSVKLWGAYIVDKTVRWKKDGEGSGKKAEIIVFDTVNNKVITPLNYTYNQVERITFFPIRDEGISIGNAYIETRTVNQITDFCSRGIWIRNTGNVRIHNIHHTIDENYHANKSTESNKNANRYRGFIDIQTTAFIELDNINLQAHTSMPYKGTYDLGVQNVAYLYLNNIGYTDYNKDIVDNNRWGVMGTNEVKNMFLTNSTMSRMDAHRDIYELYVKDTTLGVKGVTLTGLGNFYGENIFFDRAKMPITLREDYGATWNGNMYFRNTVFRIDDRDYTFLIYAKNSQTEDKGYDTYFPNLYMNGIYMYSSAYADKVYGTLWNDIQNPNVLTNRYQYKGNIQIKDLTTKNVKDFEFFSWDFQQNSKNFELSNYGGTNKVKLDLDSKIKTSAINSASNPKFIKGSVTNDQEESTKTSLIRKYDYGKNIINGPDIYIPITKLTASKRNITMGPNDTEIISFSFEPTIAEKDFDIKYYDNDDTEYKDESDIITMSKNGIIRPKTMGKVTIKILDPMGGRELETIKVNVLVKVTSIKLNKTVAKLKVNNTVQLKATINPSNATNKKVKWTSSNESVATVDNDGLVTAISTGYTEIRATATDGSKVYGKCDVGVGDKISLVSIYNSAKGADVRFRPYEGVDAYVLMRKTDGVWSEVKTVKANEVTKLNAKQLQIFDETIKNNYGRGYIYSVAAKVGNVVLDYNTLGLAIYRLKQPTITNVTSNKKGQVNITWTKETCHGYEIQYSSDNGTNWIKYPEIKDPNITNLTINNLTSNTKYIFRVRCQKTNPDRGTGWSQYSAWKNIVVK